MCSCVCALSWDFFQGFFFFLYFTGRKVNRPLLCWTAPPQQRRLVESSHRFWIRQVEAPASIMDGPKNNLGGKPTLFCILTSFDRMAAALLISPLTLASRCLSAVTRLGYFCRGVWLSALIYLSSPRLLTRLACIHQHPSTTRRSKKQVPVSSLQRFPPHSCWAGTSLADGPRPTASCRRPPPFIAQVSRTLMNGRDLPLTLS